MKLLLLTMPCFTARRSLHFMAPMANHAGATYAYASSKGVTTPRQNYGVHCFQMTIACFVLKLLDSGKV